MRKTLLLLTTTALALLVAGGVALAGTAWAVPDGTTPTVLATIPDDGAVNVALDAKIRVKFSEPMKDRTINPNNIKVYIGCTDTLLTSAQTPKPRILAA
jgi:Bacterial Ig-like domain